MQSQWVSAPFTSQLCVCVDQRLWKSLIISGRPQSKQPMHRLQALHCESWLTGRHWHTLNVPGDTSFEYNVLRIIHGRFTRAYSNSHGVGGWGGGGGGACPQLSAEWILQAHLTALSLSPWCFIHESGFKPLHLASSVAPRGFELFQRWRLIDF